MGFFYAGSLVSSYCCSYDLACVFMRNICCAGRSVRCVCVLLRRCRLTWKALSDVFPILAGASCMSVVLVVLRLHGTAGVLFFLGLLQSLCPHSYCWGFLFDTIHRVSLVIMKMILKAERFWLWWTLRRTLSQSHMNVFIFVAHCGPYDACS